MSAQWADRSVWPEGISDGLSLACADCDQLPRFDYHVTEEFWRRWVPGSERTGVVCLPCLDRRCEGVGLAAALERIQWTGTGHTVVLQPTARYEFRSIFREEGPPAESREAEALRAAIVDEARKVHESQQVSGSTLAPGERGIGGQQMTGWIRAEPFEDLLTATYALLRYESLQEASTSSAGAADD